MPHGITQNYAKYQWSWSNRSWDKWWFNQMLQENEEILDTWPNALYSFCGLNRILKYCQVLGKSPHSVSNQVCYVVSAFAEITVLVNQSRREARHWFKFKSFEFCLPFYIQYCDDQTWDRSFAIWLKGCLVQEPNSDELKNVVHNHFSWNRNMIHFSEFLEQNLLKNFIFILVPSFTTDYQLS